MFVTVLRNMRDIHFRDFPRTQVGNFFTGYGYGPGINLAQPCNCLNQLTLSVAVDSCYAENFSCLHVKAEPVQYLYTIFVLAADIRQLEDA
ncbi:hypothetical protein D3C75_981870 [compost metagenome]